MYEKHHHRLAPFKLFIKRVALNSMLGFGIILFSLVVGVFGYAYFEKMSLVDAYANAAMILSGMGPLGGLNTTGEKIFAGTYALFSGVIFLIVMAIIFAPIFHRLFHNFLIKDR